MPRKSCNRGKREKGLTQSQRSSKVNGQQALCSHQLFCFIAPKVIDACPVPRFEGPETASIVSAIPSLVSSTLLQPFPVYLSPTIP